MAWQRPNLGYRGCLNHSVRGLNEWELQHDDKHDNWQLPHARDITSYMGLMANSPEENRTAESYWRTQHKEQGTSSLKNHMNMNRKRLVRIVVNEIVELKRYLRQLCRCNVSVRIWASFTREGTRNAGRKPLTDFRSGTATRTSTGPLERRVYDPLHHSDAPYSGLTMSTAMMMLLIEI